MQQSLFLAKFNALFNLSSSPLNGVLIILLFSFFAKNIKAQDTTNYFSLNLQGSIYAQQEEKSSHYKSSPIPEIEFLYKFYQVKKLSAFTGLQYSYSHWHKNMGVKSEWKRQAHEVALPLFIEHTVGKYLSLQGGINIGYLIKGKMQYKNNIPAHPSWEDVTYQTDYNEKSKFYFELFLSPKLKYNLDLNNIIALGPTLIHKPKDNWMEEIRPKTMFGITLQYSFQF